MRGGYQLLLYSVPIITSSKAGETPLGIGNRTVMNWSLYAIFNHLYSLPSTLFLCLSQAAWLTQIDGFWSKELDSDILG